MEKTTEKHAKMKTSYPRLREGSGIYMVEREEGDFAIPTQEELDSLPLGPDLTEEEINELAE